MHFRLCQLLPLTPAAPSLPCSQSCSRYAPGWQRLWNRTIRGCGDWRGRRTDHVLDRVPCWLLCYWSPAFRDACASEVHAGHREWRKRWDWSAVAQSSTTFPIIAIKQQLTLSPSILLWLYTLPYWSNPPFLISDIRALWRSGLSARAPECQKLKMVG